MKRILKTVAFSLLLVSGSLLQNTAKAQNYNEGREVSYQTFYDDLSPYGRWVDYPEYGYVWVPDAGPDFRPYSSNGHWVWTEDYEWMWVSDYDWGWAPFHYGRWMEDEYYGWMWVPGYEWSPAWVAWRDGGDYYGWAPLRPGISISINFNIGSYNPPYDYWCFAPRRYITSPRIYDYCMDRRQNITIINYTTIIVNNFHYNSNYGFRSGPSRFEAERYCGRINPVRFRDSYTPGRTQFRNNEVSIYRPNVRHDNDNNRVAPRQFDRYERKDDSRVVRNDNGFRRNDNNQNNNQGNNRDRDNNSPFKRNENTVRQPQNNDNNNPDRRRVERNDNTRQPGNNGNTRIFKPSEQPDRNPGQGNTNNNDNRRTERRNFENNNSNQQPIRQSPVRNDRPVQQMERREQPVQQQQQPRQFERRGNDNVNRQPVQQQQPRQFERQGNNNGNRQQQNNNDNRGNKDSRRRF